MSPDFNALIAEATRYARFTMNKSGCLAPVMMASTEQGLILFTPDSLSDTGAKDDFANKVRLITASYGANAVVLILESWITKAKPGENFDAETPPSESYDREEVVVLIGQSPQGNITRLLPIHRLGNGKFWNLGDAEEMPRRWPPTVFQDALPNYCRQSHLTKRPARWAKRCFRPWA